MNQILHICPWAGCDELVPLRKRYCEKHQAEANRRRRSNKPRPPSSRRGYDSKWRRTRQAVLKERPYCEQCRKAKATEVHHLVPLCAGGTNERPNLVALCKSCHSRITSAAGGRG